MKNYGQTIVYGRGEYRQMQDADRQPGTPVCLAYSDPAPAVKYACTRNRHHDGDHEAARIGGKIVATWPQETEEAL